MIMLSKGKSLEENRIGWRGAACDYSSVSSVDYFLILECHRRRISQERHMWEPRVDERFISVQKKSNSLEGPQKVEAIELSILWRRYNLERKCWGESKSRRFVQSKITL